MFYDFEVLWLMVYAFFICSVQIALERYCLFGGLICKVWGTDRNAKELSVTVTIGQSAICRLLSIRYSTARCFFEGGCKFVCFAA